MSLTWSSTPAVSPASASLILVLNDFEDADVVGGMRHPVCRQDRMHVPGDRGVRRRRHLADEG
ncbi:hypothetical protein, partial [Sphaerisporangium album]|uniref:hypothetical protein n=1 Tax=Sphaerisporangium album TaxID=509200 RepID=UPI001FE52EA0